MTSTDYYRLNRVTRKVVYECPHCDYETTGSRIQLQNHVYARHTPESQRPYLCEAPGCSRGFAQLLHLIQHAKRVHDVSLPRPRRPTSVGYSISLTSRKPRSRKTQARRDYYHKHPWVKSSSINGKKHQYLPGIYLRVHDLNYDASKGFITLRRCKLTGEPCRIHGPLRTHVCG